MLVTIFSAVEMGCTWYRQKYSYSHAALGGGVSLAIITPGKTKQFYRN
jgi:hypothetical protein